MDEQVKIFCKYCRTLIAFFDDFTHRNQGLMFFKKVSNMEALGPAEFVLYREHKVMGSLHCNGCRRCRGVGPLEFNESGANGNNDEEDKVYGLILFQIIMMRGDKQIEASSSEAEALFEEGCKRCELAEEKGKSSDAVNELGAVERISSEYMKAVKKLGNIRRIREALGDGESAKAGAAVGARFEKLTPGMQLQLAAIDMEIEKVHSIRENELENNSEEVTKLIEDIEKGIRMMASVIGAIEDELVENIDRGQASDAPEKAPNEPGTGEQTSSKAVNELGPFEKIESEFTEVRERFKIVTGGIVTSLENEGSEVSAELGAHFEREVPRMRLELHDIEADIEKVRSSASTETEPRKSSQKFTQELQRIQRKITVIASQIGRLEDLAADIDRRQASDAPETTPEESGAAIEKKKGSSRAAMGEGTSSEAVNELGALGKVHSEYTEVVKRLKSITIGIRTSIENGEGSEAAAELGARFDREIPSMQLKLTDIDAEIKKVHSSSSTETEPGKSSQNVTQALERIQRKITIIASLIGGFEEELAAGINRRQASDAPETAPEESGAAIEKKTGISREAMEKGTSTEAVNELGPFEKIHSEHTEAVKRLLNITSIRESLGNGEGSEEVAELVEHLDSQISHMQLKLTDIDVEIEKVRSRALTETELVAEVTQAIERIERKITVIASHIRRFEEDIVADVDSRQASDAPEKAPKESGTAIEKKTSSSRAATGEGRSSKAITEQATRIGQLQYMGSELADTETEHANLDTKQTSDELGK